jgi:hypothetical protein
MGLPTDTEFVSERTKDTTIVCGRSEHFDRFNRLLGITQHS